MRRRAFASDTSGVAAIEFAMIVPMLLILYMGASDASMAVTLNRKLQGTASTVADLIAQENTTTKANLALTLGIAKALVQPYDSSKLTAVQSSVTIDATGKATVDWSSATTGATAYTKGAVFTLPSALTSQRSRSFVIVETGYTYPALGGYGFALPIPMRETAYVTPRNTTTAIVCTDC